MADLAQGIAFAYDPDGYWVEIYWVEIYWVEIYWVEINQAPAAGH